VRSLACARDDTLLARISLPLEGVRSLLTFVLCVFLSVVAAHAQINDSTSLREVEFSQLSQRDPNPLAEKALAINPEQWRHAESEHFIYHFVHSYVATPVSVEAEFHYRVIAKELEREHAPTDIKSNIYIFERPEEWREFQAYGKLEQWTGGIHSAGSLFIQRNPSYRFSDNSLGHEVVHLVLHRFYTDSIPRWLDEGFAQFISKDAHSSFERARGYISKPHSDSIAPQDLIPLTVLTTTTHPPSDRVHIFYDESERLVRFLAATDKPSFLTLLDSLARHQPLETILPRLYSGRFTNIAALEENFREYASKDFGTSLQQASVE
jgi:hypothetical protein